MVGMRVGGRGVEVDAGYPQLKLAASEQPLCPSTRLDRIYVLRPAATGEWFTTRRLRGPEKLLALTEHSVAAKLFPGALLGRHLAFCRAAAYTEIVEIVYPRTGAALEQAARLVASSPGTDSHVP